MRLMVALVTLSLLAGCASRQVRCDGRLTPINASAKHEGRAP
jgi:hypothetical protein